MAQSTFPIATGADDGEIEKSGAAYPPASAASVNTAGTGIDVRKRLSAGTYMTRVAAFRFDTSTLDDGATVTGAKLVVHIGAVLNANSRNLNVEWMADGAIAAGDYSDSVGTDAFTAGIGTLGIGAPYELVLSTPTNVSKTAYTKFRLGISGAAPTGENEVTIISFDHATLQEPQLVVDYTPAVAVGPFAMRRLGTSWR